MARGMRRVPTYYQDLVDIIAPNKGNVIASSACLGNALSPQILKYNENKDENLYNKIKNWIVKMDEIFDHGNFFLELQPNLSKEQVIVNNEMLKLSKELDIPFIITCDTHYLKKEDRNAHRVYLKAQNGEREVDSFYETTYLMSSEEVESNLKIGPAAIDEAYQNIEKIIDMCEDYSLERPLKIPQLPWESHPQPSTEEKDKYFKLIPELFEFYIDGYEGDKVLANAIMNKISSDVTLQNKETYDEVNECLKMTRISSEVNKTHWSAYFLNLEKIVKECWNAGTLVGCGRGSGVGFILLYLLDITQINPLRETSKTARWRFLNPARVSVLDVDIDIQGDRREEVLNHLRKVYGEDRVCNVATFGTEKSKSAILTAARGLEIDVDIAQYLSSMVEADRGMTRTLAQTFYGDKEAGFGANKQFVYEMTENYPELWEIAQKIEGLVCRLGEHAGGIVFVDEDFTNSTALMRAPNGDTVSQFELHDLEAEGNIKYDLLSVEALDKIHICLDLLKDYGYIEDKGNLRDTYESVIGIYNLERESPEMWKMIWNHKIQSLFQMEQQSGIQGIALTRPQSVDDLAILNSVIRLMAQEKGAEQPLNKYSRFKNNISLWYDEMDSYGLTEEEQRLLEPILKISYGLCESQERRVKRSLNRLNCGKALRVLTTKLL